MDKSADCLVPLPRKQQKEQKHLWVKIPFRSKDCTLKKDGKLVYHYSNRTSVEINSRLLSIGQFRYVKIRTWLRGLGESHRGSVINVLFLLCYSPKPRKQVRVLRYRNWYIDFA